MQYREVTPLAEDIVVRAAYKGLAQRSDSFLLFLPY
jgi:hypothetical protein